MATAAEVMTTEVVVVNADTPIREIARLLSSKRFGSLPVLDAAGVVVGIVTEEDMVTRAAKIHLPRHLDFLGGIVYLESPQSFEAEAQKILAVTAREIMDTRFPAVQPEAPVEDVAAMLLEEGVRRVLVLDEQRRLLGIITRADIVRMLQAKGNIPEGGA